LPVAHLYVFSDGSPDDWLVDGHDERWHTIANLVIQSDPARIEDIKRGVSHEELLPLDPFYNTIVGSISSGLPSHTLRKWKTGPQYRARFCRAFADGLTKSRPMISACSFQERTLRDSKQALMASYNRHLGGIEGRGINFEESVDDRCRKRLKHSFVHWRTGYHEIEGLENQILVLLFMAWFIADQYRFHYRKLVSSGTCGFDELRLTVVSDKLSGDDDLRRKSEENLRNLIDPENNAVHVAVIRSRVSDEFSGDLLADNLAGWLNNSMVDPNGTYAEQAKSLAPSGLWTGWHQLQPSNDLLTACPAVDLLK
jgi:hypothetical protein